MFDILLLCVMIGIAPRENLILYVWNKENMRRYVMDFEAIRKAAEGYKPAMVKFLRDMIAIPSESCE